MLLKRNPISERKFKLTPKEHGRSLSGNIKLYLKFTYQINNIRAVKKNLCVSFKAIKIDWSYFKNLLLKWIQKNTVEFQISTFFFPLEIN